jgi:hypothetical protein
MRALAIVALLAGAAQAATVDSVLASLKATSEKTKVLSGNFTQKNRVKLFKKELVSRGKFRFERPRQIRWEYVSPDPSTLVLDGNRATLSMPGQEPRVFDLATDPTMRAVFDQLLVWLGAGDADPRRDYDVSVSGPDSAPSLVLVPRAGSTLGRVFTRIELRTDGKGLVRGILLVESSGDEKDIAFEGLKRD